MTAYRAGMTGHGIDISVWQNANVIPGWAFVILNHEDPTVNAKIDLILELGLPYAFYGWLYPGHGRETLTRMKAHDELLALNGDRRPSFYWLDYEQNGVTPGDLADGLQAAVDEGVARKTGTYTYLSVVGSVGGVINEFGSPLWLAYYPAPNDGHYPAGQEGDALRWGAVLWQYSSGGNLDRNVVLDEAWWAAHNNGSGDDMPSNEELDRYFLQPIDFQGNPNPNGVSRLGAVVRNELTRSLDTLAGWEHDTRAQIIAAIAGIPHDGPGTPLDPAALATAIAKALGPQQGKLLVKALHDALAD